MPISPTDLENLRRSAAMIQPHQSLPVNRQDVLAMCDELVESRSLLARLGTDLKTVAGKAPKRS